MNFQRRSRVAPASASALWDLSSDIPKRSQRTPNLCPPWIPRVLANSRVSTKASGDGTSLPIRMHSISRNLQSNATTLWPTIIEPSIISQIESRCSPKLSASLTSSSNMPCTLLDSTGILHPGLTSDCILSCEPSESLPTSANCTTLSCRGLNPVVSKSNPRTLNPPRKSETTSPRCRHHP